MADIVGFNSVEEAMMEGKTVCVSSGSDERGYYERHKFLNVEGEYEIWEVEFESDEVTTSPWNHITDTFFIE